MMKKAILILIVAAICSISYSQDDYDIISRILEKDSIPMNHLFELNLKIAKGVIMEYDVNTHDTKIIEIKNINEHEAIDFPRILRSHYEIQDTFPMPDSSLWRWKINCIHEKNDLYLTKVLVSPGGNIFADVSTPVNWKLTWTIFFADGFWDESLNKYLTTAEVNP